MDQEEVKKPFFVVKKWNAVAQWSWSIMVDNCAICRNHLMERCIQCQGSSEYMNELNDCRIAWGTCKHGFHYHCISKWLEARPVCPLDNQQWVYDNSKNDVEDKNNNN